MVVLTAAVVYIFPELTEMVRAVQFPLRLKSMVTLNSGISRMPRVG